MNTLITTLASVTFAAFSACIPACAHAQAPAQPQTSPTLNWNQVALDTVVRVKPSQHQAVRLLAYMSLAQYAALSQAQGDAAIADAVATASMRVIADLAPSQAAFVEERLRELGARESDSGRRVAQSVLAQAHSDEFVRTLATQPAQGAYTWRSLANPPAPPAYPALGAMRPFLLESGNVFRSAPPPSMANVQFLNDLTEVRHYTMAPTQESTRIAKFYDMTTGTLAAGFWNEQAAALIRKNNMSERHAARVLATMNTANMASHPLHSRTISDGACAQQTREERLLRNFGLGISGKFGGVASAP